MTVPSISGVATRGRYAALGQPPHDASLWRPLRYFNVARFLVAAVLLTYLIFAPELRQVGGARPTWFANTALAYLVASAFFAWGVRRLQTAYLAHVILQAFVDILVVTLLVHASGGVRSGLGILMLMPVAGAAILVRGRLALFFAALASIALLLENTYWVLNFEIGRAEYFLVALLASSCFMVAIIVSQLAGRLLANEVLARQRSIDFANQLAVNRLVVRDMEDGVVVVADDGTVMLANPAAARFAGRALPRTGDDLADFSPTLGHAFARWRERQALTTSPTTPPMPREQEVQLAGGRARVRFASAGSPEQGEVILFLQDVAAIEQRAQQLKLASLGRLTASIAHEIRNPLSAIRHASELMSEDAALRTASESSRLQLKLTRIIGENTVRLNRIVEEVLQLNRRDRGLPQLLDLRDIVTAQVAQLAETENLPAGLIEIKVPAGIDIRFDPEHLNQVLWNLLSNALRYGSGKAAAVRIGVLAGAEVRPIELFVLDDGPGIAAELATQVFEPFFTTHAKGSGLGLYIARDLCSANHASLDLLPPNPEDPSGARFRLRFGG